MGAEDDPRASSAQARAPGREVSVPWSLAQRSARDSVELHVAFDEMEYLTSPRVVVDETAARLKISVAAWWEPPSGGWFAETSSAQRVVRLDGPLGRRRLVHGPTDWPILWKPGMRLD